MKNVFSKQENWILFNVQHGNYTWYFSKLKNRNWCCGLFKFSKEYLALVSPEKEAASTLSAVHSYETLSEAKPNRPNVNLRRWLLLALYFGQSILFLGGISPLTRITSLWAIYLNTKVLFLWVRGHEFAVDAGKSSTNLILTKRFCCVWSKSNVQVSKHIL